MKKKKIGTSPKTMIVVSLTAALFLIGFCGLMVVQSKKLISLVKQNLEVRVFLEKNLTQPQIDSVAVQIKTKKYVLDNLVTFVSKEQAAEEFIADTKENFKDFLGENPLRNAYRVKIVEDYFEEGKLKTIQADMAKINGVFEVVYQENLADQINKNLTKIYLILAGFATVLLFIIILLMNNTIRLALYSQRFLIRSMQLVGATNGFIQRPFLVNGAVQGLISGLIASALIVGALQLAINQIEGLHLLQDNLKLAMLLAAVVVLGVLIGVISTYQSLFRYLRLTLDDLY